VAECQRPEPPPVVSVEAREFLAREYDRIGAELIESESMGEGRVALYFGIWSAAVAGVGAIMVSAESNHPAVTSVAIGGLTVVLLLGVVTTVRISRRNYNTDKLIDSLCRLRYLLLPNNAALIRAALPWTDEQTKGRRKVLLEAGLLQVLYLANAVIPALFIVAACKRDTEMHLLVVAASSALLLQLLLVFCSNRKAWKSRRKRNREFSQQCFVAAGTNARS
jgi:hypothetical protein